MSSRRKERRKKQRQKSVAVVLLVVFGVSLLAVGIVYSVFLHRPPAASFFPENPVFYTRFNLSPSLLQAKNFSEVSKKFEDPEIFISFATNFIFGNIDPDQFNIESEDLVGWLGGEVVIGNIPTSDLSTASVLIAHVKNKEKAQEFLSNLSDQLKKRGDAINETTFREQTIVNVTGHKDISFAQTKDYVIVSSSESGIKKMIDVNLGAEKSLVDNENYKTAEKALKGNGELVFSYYDLLELSVTVLDALKLEGGNALMQKLGYGASLPSGFVLIPEGDGFKTKIFAYEGRGGEEKFKEKLSQYMPHDLIFYLEGTDLRSFTEGLLAGTSTNEEDQKSQVEGIKRAIELQYGFNIDENVFPLIKDNYAISLLRGNERGNINAGITFELKDSKTARDKLAEVEKLMLNALASLSNDGALRQFTDHSHNGTIYRYLNLPDSLKFDVSYHVFDDRLVLTTTESAMHTFIDLEEGGKKLSDDVLFKQSVSSIGSGKSSQLIYLEPQAGLKLIDELSDFDYGFVDQEVRKIESLGLKSRNTKKGVILEGFLKIKDKQ